MDSKTVNKDREELSWQHTDFRQSVKQLDLVTSSHVIRNVTLTFFLSMVFLQHKDLFSVVGGWQCWWKKNPNTIRGDNFIVQNQDCCYVFCFGKYLFYGTINKNWGRIWPCLHQHLVMGWELDYNYTTET